MIHPLRTHYDKLLLLVALAALLGSLGWVSRQQNGPRLLETGKASRGDSGATVRPVENHAKAAILPDWEVPNAQTQGEGWRYEVFTPPVLHYNPGRQGWGLVPTDPDSGALESKTVVTQPPAAEPAAFPMQLAGYIGSPDDCLVVFQSPQSTDTLMVKVGHRFADLGLTLKAFAVGKVLVRETESGPVYEATALATLYDERGRQELVLDSRTKQRTTSAAEQQISKADPSPESEPRHVAVSGPKSFP